MVFVVVVAFSAPGGGGGADETSSLGFGGGGCCGVGNLGNVNCKVSTYMIQWQSVHSLVF